MLRLRVFGLTVAATVLIGSTVGSRAVSGAAPSTVPSRPSATSPGPAAAVAVRPPVVAFTPKPLAWTKCRDHRDLECATLELPLDTLKPGVARVSISLLRAKATKSKERLGALLLNPGGPGGSGRDFAANVANSRNLAEVRRRYDLVGWDPRGVGRSSAVRCLGDTAYGEFYAADPTPDDTQELDRLSSLSKRFVDGCVSRSGSLLEHVSTADTVEDMEWIRRAMGEDKVNFLGFSYGTYLGLEFAERYPSKVGRFVLDGVLDPALSANDRTGGQAVGFERALANFLQACTPRSCTFNRSGESPEVALDRLWARLEAKPMVVRDGSSERFVGPAESQTAVLIGLYNERVGWPRLRTALNAAAAGDGAPMLAMFDLYTDRTPDGRYGNVTDSNAAVNCTDLPREGDTAAYKRFADELAAKAPHFGAFAAWSSVLCAYWPTDGPAPRPVRPTGIPPMLLVGTTRDPATPYAWSVAVQRQLPTSRLLTFDADGHTAMLTGNRCVVNAVRAFFVKGTLPDVGATCRW